MLRDRNSTLERGEGPGTTYDLEAPRYLPRDHNIWDQKVRVRNKESFKRS